MINAFENAKWIMADTASDTDTEHRYYNYLGSFNRAGGEKTTLYVSAFTQYAIWLNGSFVDGGQYEDRDFHPVYDEIDLTPFCIEGENKLVVGHYVAGKDFLTRSVGVPGIIFAVWQGEKEILVSSEETLSARDEKYLDTHEFLTSQLGFNFEYDARAGESEYRKSVLMDKVYDIAPRPIEKLVIGELMKGKRSAQGVFLEADASLPKAKRHHLAFLSARDDSFVKSAGDAVTASIEDGVRADGLYFLYDLGGETAGYLSVSLDVPEGTEVLIGYGEHCEDMRVRSAIGDRNFCFRYIAKEGTNEIFYPYQRIGLRYLQIHIYARQATVNHAGIYPTTYPISSYPAPVTDGLHKIIYDIGVNTLKTCMHEHYEDCPWREQALYALDSRIQILCGYYAFREFRFPRASLDLLSRSYREHDKLLELCSPGKTAVTIPSFTAVYIREIYEYTVYSKDITLANDVFPVIQNIIEGFCERIDGETGLIPLYQGQGLWNFYEWRDGLGGLDRIPEGEKVYESPLCAFVADALDCFARVCRIIGRGDAERYENISASIKKATHDAFFHEESGAYITRLGRDTEPRHDLTQIMMLYAGIVPDDKIASVTELVAKGAFIPVSLSMTIYRFEVLLKSGDYKEQVMHEIEERWGSMVRRGADTFWETDLGADDFYKAGSLCHGWSAVPVYIFGKYFSEDIYPGVM